MIVGWSIAEHMRAELVVDALQMAIWRRPLPGAIVHADREWWDRPAVPFHVVLAGERRHRASAALRWSSAGATLVPFDGPEGDD